MSRDRVWLKATGLLGAAALLAVAFVGCSTKPAADSEWPNDSKPRIVVSFAPLYCFTAAVAGDDAHVKNVMTTTGPHDFEPTTEHVRIITKADLLFAVGLGLDDATAKKLKDGSGNAGLAVVHLGDTVPKEQRCEGHCEHTNHGHDHQHGDDPHVWLSPDLAALMVNRVRDILKEKDPAHAAGYDQRAAAYVEKLKALKTYGLDKLKGKKDNRLISFHDSLAYFEKCYGLEIRGVLTPKAGQEPDEKQMKKLIRICADDTKPTRVIAVEPQYSASRAGESLKKELAARGVKNPVLVAIDTLETVRPADLTADWYERQMRANIDALAAALE